MKFSLVIPVHRTERYLARCLDSLVAQTDGDFEAIVVDDASPGNVCGRGGLAASDGEDAVSFDAAGTPRPQTAAEIVAQYDARFRYVRHERNRSLFQARQTGLKMAQGEYVIPFDSDDYALPGLLEALRKAIGEGERHEAGDKSGDARQSNNQTIKQSNNSPDVIAYQMMFDRNGTIAKTSIRYRDESMTGSEALDRLFASRIPCAICGKAIRREVYLKAMANLAAPSDLYLNSSEDLLQTLPILLNARTVATISYPGYCYFNRAGSLTTTLTDPARMERAAENTARVFKLLAGFIRRTPRGGEREQSERLLARLEGFKRTTVRWYRECIQSLPSTERRACEAELGRHFGERDAIPKATSEKISFWSFVFSLAIVVIHCAWTAKTEGGILSIVLFRETLSRLAVPFFFACSGYLIARHLDEPDWWRREVRKRVFSLGVPYLVWTVLLAGVVFLETRKVLGIDALGFNLCRQPTLVPLWYVRCLMLFVLTLPLLKNALDRGRVWFLAGVYVAALVATSLVWACGGTDEKGWGGFLLYGYSLEGLFFLLSGVYLQRHRTLSLSRRKSAALLAFGLSLVAVKLVLAHCHVHHPVNLNLLLAPPLLAGLWGTLKSVPLPRWLSGCAFPIFLMHCVVLFALRNAGGTYRPCNPWLEFCAGVTVPILWVNLVRRWLPRTGRILFGGRI